LFLAKFVVDGCFVCSFAEFIVGIFQKI